MAGQKPPLEINNHIKVVKMFLYFSSTGNSEHVARRLRNAFHMELSDILSIHEKTLDLQNEELFFGTTLIAKGA